MALFSTIIQGRYSDSYLVVPISGANDLTLTVDQALPRVLEFSGALTGNVNCIFPVASTDKGSSWVVYNNTSGAYTLTCKGATGTGVSVTQGKKAVLLYDSTNMVSLVDDYTSLGAAKSGANTDITALTGITTGITAAGGMNLSGSLKGNSATPAPLNLGRLSKSVAGAANVTLTAAEYANPWIELTGLLTGNIQLIVPLTSGAPWMIYNNTTGAFSVTVIGATGTGIVVAQTKRAICGSDGTNVIRWTADNP